MKRLFSTGLLTASLLALAMLAGCGDKEPVLKPVGVPVMSVWTDTIEMPVIGLRIKLDGQKKLFRDDGVFRGEMSLHYDLISAEPECSGLACYGQRSEGLVAFGNSADGMTRAVIWLHTTGDQAADRARREGLRAAAAMRMGRRADIEEFFRERGLRMQMKTINDGVLAAMVEIYALSRLGCETRLVDGDERVQASQILAGMGALEK